MRRYLQALGYRYRSLAVLFLLAFGGGGCALFQASQPGIGSSTDWSALPGWNTDSVADSWPALLQSCRVINKKPHWQEICDAATKQPSPTDETARDFFQQWFTPHPVYANSGKRTGLITGYYEPLLFGSKTPDDRFRFPLYQKPDDLLTIDLGPRFPEMKSKRLRGRVVGNKVVPYFSREEIDGDQAPLGGQELLWLDDRDDLFFLHIQGSGRVQLPGGETIGVGYADQNGHAYRSIGKLLVDSGELALKDVTLFTIRRWLKQNPDQAVALLNQNPSYVFFVSREDSGTGPVGSLNVPLTPGRSIAIDPKLVSLGGPVWLSTHFPAQPDKPLRRLMFAQDTGGAIKGYVRADVFWGHGDDAERAAGLMKSPGQLYVLLPKEASGNQE